MGVLHRAPIEDVVVKRMLSLIVNPHRYRSKAAEAFNREILPEFASNGWQSTEMDSLALAAEVKAAGT
ncbi:MAG: LysR family transcriptional regulator, partial [Coleofasciculaceae cyanobacterium]